MDIVLAAKASAALRHQDQLTQELSTLKKQALSPTYRLAVPTRILKSSAPKDCVAADVGSSTEVGVAASLEVKFLRRVQQLTKLYGTSHIYQLLDSVLSSTSL